MVLLVVVVDSDEVDTALPEVVIVAAFEVEVEVVLHHIEVQKARSAEVKQLFRQAASHKQRR